MSDTPEEKMESEKIGALAAALAKAQGQMKPAAKDSTNPHFNSKYADLAAVWAVIREPLSANGLSVMQRLGTSEKGVVITTQVMHSSGEWIRDRLVVPVAQTVSRDGKQQAWIHAFGSAVSYARRYALCAAVGVVADEDDDGNAAVGVTQPAGRREAPAQTSNRTTTDAVREKLAAKHPPKTSPWVRIQAMAVAARVDPAALKALVKEATGKGRPAELEDADVLTMGHALEELVKARGYDPVTGEVLEGAVS